MQKQLCLFCILFPTSQSYILPYEHHENNIIFPFSSVFHGSHRFAVGRMTIIYIYRYIKCISAQKVFFKRVKMLNSVPKWGSGSFHFGSGYQNRKLPSFLGSSFSVFSLCSLSWPDCLLLANLKFAHCLIQWLNAFQNGSEILSVYLCHFLMLSLRTPPCCFREILRCIHYGWQSASKAFSVKYQSCC